MESRPLVRHHRLPVDRLLRPRGLRLRRGLLAPFVEQRTAERQRQSLETIGPVWDGNEVWLITAVGAMFAAFPAWYAGMFSAFYLPVVLVLVGLIVRGVGLEWRGKVTNPAWCDLGIVVGSALPAFLWGAVFADLLFGSAAAALVGGALHARAVRAARRGLPGAQDRRPGTPARPHGRAGRERRGPARWLWWRCPTLGSPRR